MQGLQEAVICLPLLQGFSGNSPRVLIFQGFGDGAFCAHDGLRPGSMEVLPLGLQHNQPTMPSPKAIVSPKHRKPSTYIQANSSILTSKPLSLNLETYVFLYLLRTKATPTT